MTGKEDGNGVLPRAKLVGEKTLEIRSKVNEEMKKNASESW